MLNYWLEQHPVLTESETMAEIERLNKNAGIILKMGLSPNVLQPYAVDPALALWVGAIALRVLLYLVCFCALERKRFKNLISKIWDA